MAFKQRSQGSSFKQMGSSPAKQEIIETERSKEIKKGIKDKTKKEKEGILKRNIHAFPYGRLKKGEEYRKEMPELMQNIALASDSVRAVYHSDIEEEKKKN